MLLETNVYTQNTLLRTTNAQERVIFLQFLELANSFFTKDLS